MGTGTAWQTLRSSRSPASRSTTVTASVRPCSCACTPSTTSSSRSSTCTGTSSAPTSSGCTRCSTRRSRPCAAWSTRQPSAWRLSGCAPVGTPGHLVAARTWDDYTLLRDDTTAHLAALDLVYTGVIEDHRKDIELTDDLDLVTQDLLIAQVGQLELFQWFIRAHLESTSGELSNAGAQRETEAARAATRTAAASGGVAAGATKRAATQDRAQDGEEGRQEGPSADPAAAAPTPLVEAPGHRHPHRKEPTCPRSPSAPKPSCATTPRAASRPSSSSRRA